MSRGYSASPAPRLFPFLNLPPLFLYLFQLSAPREFVIAFNFSSPANAFLSEEKRFDARLDSIARFRELFRK